MRRCGTTIAFAIALAAAPLAAQQPVLVPANTYHGQLLGLAVHDPQVAIAVGADGIVLRTQDAGASWWRIPAGSAAELEDVAFVGVTVFAVGANGTILRSSDGGVNWQMVVSGVSAGLEGVHFGDALHGIIVGDSGVALMTQDGGATWTRSQTGVLANLIDVRMSGPAVATAVGTQGTILRTDDGGRSWRRQGALASQYLTGVYMASPTSAIAVGLNGVGFATSDAGATWMPVSLGTSMSMSDISQSPGGTYYSAGSTATIIRSADGLNWQLAFQGNGYAFEDVVFADALNGWAVGNNGVVMHTTDGGTTWVHQMGIPGQAAVAAAPAPALVPSGAPLYLQILGLTMAQPGGRGSWYTAVGSSSGGNRMDEIHGTGAAGETYLVSLIYAGDGRPCANMLATIFQQGGQMRTAPAYLPANWFQVAIEQNNVSSFVCLPLARGVLVAGFTVASLQNADAGVVRPMLTALGEAAFQRWGRP